MQTSVRFILDDRIVEIDFSKQKDIKPSTTVLNFLRSLSDHKGVKEGCAEGDCGACTVVIAECGKNGKLVYQSVDSCLVFLPMIHGKQLITVENLATSENGVKVLHPVQQLMVEESGSQCGYCTPGIIMSLFAIYKNHSEPDQETIGAALAGNLCRCTGYRSILEATKKACSGDGSDQFSKDETRILQLLSEISVNREPLELTGLNQKYYKPFSLQDAIRFRNNHPDAIIINGSTDIALKQTKKHEHLDCILDLSGVEELRGFRFDQGQITAGAGLSIEQLRHKIKGILPALEEMISVFGSLQIRNVATIGGNICSASPIGDTLPVLFVYRAKVILQSVSGERIIDIEEFIRGYRRTDLKPDELLTGIIIPVPGKETIVQAYKISRRKDLDISTVSAAVRLKRSKNIVSEIVIVYGGMAEMTKRARRTESFLQGKEWSEKTILEAGKILDTEFTPLSDARSGADYRSKVAGNLLLKFYHQSSG